VFGEKNWTQNVIATESDRNYLFHCYSIACDFCLSVSLSSLLYSRTFYSILTKFYTKVGAPKSKNAFVMGQNPMTPSPMLPHFFTPVMHFQWEGPNTAVTRPVGYKHKVAKCCNQHFAP